MLKVAIFESVESMQTWSDSIERNQIINIFFHDNDLSNDRHIVYYWEPKV